MINDSCFPGLDTYFGGYDDFDIASWSDEELTHEYECLQENFYNVFQEKEQIKAKLLDYQAFVKDLADILVVPFDADVKAVDSLTSKEKLTIFRRINVTLEENVLLQAVNDNE